MAIAFFIWRDRKHINARIFSPALCATVPAVAVVVAIIVALAIRLVVFLIKRDQIGQRESRREL